MCSVGGSLLAGVHLEEMPTSQRTVVQLQQADPAQPKPLIVSVWVQKTVKEKVKLHYVSLKLIEIQLAPTILYRPNSMSSSITDSLTTQWDGSIFEIISAALSYLLKGTSQFLCNCLIFLNFWFLSLGTNLATWKDISTAVSDFYYYHFDTGQVLWFISSVCFLITAFLVTPQMFGAHPLWIQRCMWKVSLIFFFFFLNQNRIGKWRLETKNKGFYKEKVNNFLGPWGRKSIHVLC